MKPNVLRVDMGDWEDEKVYALYTTFAVKGEESNYEISISDYEGDAGRWQLLYGDPWRSD